MMIALITGSTDGIGRETARELAQRGFRVLVHGRNQAKASAAARSVGGSPVWGDFSSLAEVRTLADQVGEVDVLLNNAGIYARGRRETQDGFEETLQVNHLAPFLLTHLLLSRIRKQIINVSSGVHAGAHLEEPFERLNDLGGYEAYAASKLANLLFTFALARRTRLAVNALHPGVIGTKLLRGGFGGGGAEVAEGAATPVMLATMDPPPTAKYFSYGRETRPSAESRDEALQESFYRWSAAQVGVEPLS